jgi:hypothetical protein
MKSKLKMTMIILFSVVMIYVIPKISLAEATDQIYYIKNNYSQGAYLYEENGVLRYGIPMPGDKSFQWIIEEKTSYKTIKNAATNHCITLEGHGDDTVEGNWGEAVQCVPLSEGKDSFLWDFTIGEGQNLLSASAAYTGFVLHLENAANGQVIGQKVSGDQLSWGNMKWDVVTEDKVELSSMLNAGFCIQNAGDGTYLRVDNGILTRGTPDGPDNAYIWEIEQRSDGMKAIKNKLTSQYITMSNYDETTYTLGLEDGTKDNGQVSWNFQLSKGTVILSASPEYKGYGLYLDVASKNKARCKDILTGTNELTDSMKWNFCPSGEVSEVAGDLVLEEGIYNLKNSYYSLYLMEDNGAAIYGNAKPTDKNAQWEILYEEATGYTALKNAETGDYLYAKEDTGQLLFDHSAKFYWKMKRHTNDDYPNAVIFQDSDHADSYLHMESLNGFAEDSNAVQPTWGTPHWEPIRLEEDITDNASRGGTATVPEDYIRLYCTVKEGEYLYENSSGAVLYKKCDAADARSHWKLVAGDTLGTFWIQNRETGEYITNKGNGTLRCLPKDQASSEGSLWEISAGNAEGKLLINNYYEDTKPCLRPYLNIKQLSGFVQSSLVSNEEETTQWFYETAQEETSSAAEAEKNQIPLNTLKDTNLYKLLYHGQSLDSLYQFEYYGSLVRIIDTKSDNYLYYEDGWKLKESADPADKTIQWKLNEKAGEMILVNGDTKLQANKEISDSVYSADNAYINGDKRIFTVYADQSENYQIGFEYSGKKTTAELEVNGISTGNYSFPAKEDIHLFLNKGVNTIAIPEEIKVAGLTVLQSTSRSYRGASVTYTQYQAEDCNTNGTILEEDRTYRSVTSEASGRLAVSLDGTGQYIKFTLTEPANSLVIRYCIPDNEEGAGQDQTLNLYMDGKKSQSFGLTSRYNWVYGSYPWTNQPADGQAHHFFDETSILLDQTYPAGTVVKLQKDAANQAEYYIIDFVDTEEIPEANQRPENSLSVTDFGAVAGDGMDDSKAFYDCIKASLDQEKEVWIPEGVFDISTPTSDYDPGDQQDKNRGIILTEDNLVIRGAGMWYSVLQGDYAAFFIKASNISLYDFSLRGTATARRDSIDPSAIETDYNTPVMKNLTVQNVWIEHYKTGIWTHNMDGMHIIGCRIRDTFADGMNLRKGTSNAIVEQCDVRNTGDDAIALWSSAASDTNVKIRFNTVSLQWLANNIAIYGGTDIEITDNLIMDTVVNGAGVNISSNFDPEPFQGTITVARNTFQRCGSADSNNNQNDGAIWFNTVQGNDNHAQIIIKDNVILDSTFQGISFSNRGTVDNVLLEGNAIDGCGSNGIEIIKGAKGSVILKNNQIQNMMLEELSNGAPDTFTVTAEDTELHRTNQKKLRMPDYVPVLIIVSVTVLAAGFLYMLTRKKIR